LAGIDSKGVVLVKKLQRRIIARTKICHLLKHPLDTMPSVGENVPSQVLPVQKTDILKIALILGVCLTVLLALYTAFRPKKPQERYFDEDDF